MGFLDHAGLAHLWDKVKAGLGLKMDTSVYDPAGKGEDVFGYADTKAAAAETAAKAASRPAGWMPTVSEVGAAKPAVGVSATLLSSAWTGSAAPYTQTVSVADLEADANGTVGLSQSATAEQRAAARDAMLCVTAQANGSLTVTADGVKPTADIPITVTILG